MRTLPDYLPYRQANPPRVRRWLSLGALLSLTCAGGMALIPEGGSAFGLACLGMATGSVLTGICWSIRLLYYRISLHNAHYYGQRVKQDRQAWWAKHQQTFALRETVLLGPVGSEPDHWLSLLSREHKVPEEKREAGGRALRLIHSFVNDAQAREQQLAKMLARQWLAQREGRESPVLSQCYWQGSEPAWQAFCEQIAADLPALELPVTPQTWQGEASLSAIATQVNITGSECLVLVAGCQSLTATPASVLPAGESAVLWLASRDGPAWVSRGEVYDASSAEEISAVCKRVLQQSSVKKLPEACILFTPSQSSALAKSGWNMTQYLQDANWGDTGNMEALIVLTLAAMYAVKNQQPCGWIARDPLHTLALGIIKPDGTEK